MILASGSSTKRPSSARSSSTARSPKTSGNCASIRPASEMSRVSISTPAVATKERAARKKACVASAGASSAHV